MFEADEISQSCCPLRERLTTLLHTPSLEETGVGGVLFDISCFALLDDIDFVLCLRRVL